MTIKLGGFIAHPKIFRLRFVKSNDYVIRRNDVSLDTPSWIL